MKTRQGRTRADLLRCDYSGCKLKFHSHQARICHKVAVHKTGLRKLAKETVVSNNTADNQDQKLTSHHFVCEYLGCGRKFHYRHSLISHRNSAHKPATRSRVKSATSKVTHRPATRNQVQSVEKPESQEELGLSKKTADEKKNANHNELSPLKNRSGYRNRISVDKTYKCDFPGCDQKYYHITSVLRHKMAKHKSRPSEYIKNTERKVCAKKQHGQKFPLLPRLAKKRHVKGSILAQKFTRRNGNILNFKFTCNYPGCKLKYCKKSSMLQHQVLEHSKNKRNDAEKFACGYPGCKLEYFNKVCMIRHQMIAHKSAKTAPAANTDQDKDDDTNKKFACAYPGCEMKYSNSNSLYSHQSRRKHRLCDRQQVVKFTCDYPGCEVKYNQYSSLYRHHKKLPEHKLSATKPRVVVKTLSESTSKKLSESRKKALAVRAKYRGIYTAVRNVVCDYPGCGAKYTQSSSLSRHHSHFPEHKMSTGKKSKNRKKASSVSVKFRGMNHRSGKHFVCEYPDCGMKFNSFSSFYRHHRKFPDHKLSTTTKQDVPDKKQADTPDPSKMNLTSPSTGQIFVCDFPGCEYKYSQHCSLLRHKKMAGHSATTTNQPSNTQAIVKKKYSAAHKKLTCDFPGCEQKYYFNKHSLMRHKKAMHNVEEDYQTLVSDTLTSGTHSNAILPIIEIDRPLSEQSFLNTSGERPLSVASSLEIVDIEVPTPVHCFKAPDAQRPISDCLVKVEKVSSELSSHTPVPQYLSASQQLSSADNSCLEVSPDVLSLMTIKVEQPNNDVLLDSDADGLNYKVNTILFEPKKEVGDVDVGSGSRSVAGNNSLFETHRYSQVAENVGGTNVAVPISTYPATDDANEYLHTTGTMEEMNNVIIIPEQHTETSANSSYEDNGIQPYVNDSDNMQGTQSVMETNSPAVEPAHQGQSSDSSNENGGNEPYDMTDVESSDLARYLQGEKM